MFFGQYKSEVKEPQLARKPSLRLIKIKKILYFHQITIIYAYYYANVEKYFNRKILQHYHVICVESQTITVK